MALSSRIAFLITVTLLTVTCLPTLSGQDRILKGLVTDSTGTVIQGVSVYLPAYGTGTVTKKDGSFRLLLAPEMADQVRVIFSCMGYRADTITLAAGNLPGQLHILLTAETVNIQEVSIRASRSDNVTIINVPSVAGAVIPSVTGGIESAIATLPGVATFSELSYTYSVRGGSYDENLVYINDVEVYRPYLIRSGQQEGLSRINPDLTASVHFSPGGFSASYGDRMSSVLDITYREPEKREGSVSLSLFTSSLHAGARSRNNRFWFLAGARYRNNSILLGSLDSKGDYRPSFADIQAIAGYSPDSRTKLTLSLWGSSNNYVFIPRSQTTTFGTIENAYRLYAFFDGGERDRYINGGMALTLGLRHGDMLSSKFILSAYLADENESYDIRGAYSLSALDKTEGTENNPDTILNAGAGSWLSHARNRLRAGVAGLTYKGTFARDRNSLDWGIAAKYRGFDAFRNEWLRVDSAGYTLGTDSEGLTLTSWSDHSTSLGSFTSEAYLISRSIFILAGRQWELNAGARASYDTYYSEMLVSPRLSLRVKLSDRFSTYLAAGSYHQPPGGREIMIENESALPLLKAQRSYHLTAGARYDFIAWDRPFRFTVEAYGKLFDRLVPYSIDNVRLVYYGGNIAEGYSTGVDMRINGEFVQGAESWFSLSLMKSEMNIPSLNSGWYPSPFDQRVNFSIFFQDYLPGHPDFRAHINITFGTGIPASPPGRDQWDIWFRMPPYRRIDIGFSKILVGSDRMNKDSFLRELVAGFEIYNLADIRNTISYTWIRTVRNSEGETREYAVPNYLTKRSLNLKLTAQF